MLVNIIIAFMIICVLKITSIYCELSYFKNVLIYTIIRTSLVFIIAGFFNLLYFVVGFSLFFIIGTALIGILKILSEYSDGIGFLFAGIVAENILATIAAVILNLIA